MRPDPVDPTPRETARQTTHLRRRAQRAEAEARDLAARLDALQAEIAAEREMLQSYINGPEHEHDLLLGAQGWVARAIRNLATQHQSCESCGGFRRVALDALLEPELAAMRAELDLPEPPPLDERAGYWTMRPGYKHYRGKILEPYRTPEEQRRYKQKLGWN